MALLQVAGIASILPFMQLAADQEAIFKNEWLNYFYESFDFQSPDSMLIALGVAVIVLLAGVNLFSIFTGWLQVKIAWDIAHRLCNDLLAIYLSRPYLFFLKQNTSKLQTKLLQEVGKVTTSVLIPMIEVISQAFMTLVIFALVVAINPLLSLAVFAILTTAYAIIYFTRKQLMVTLGKDRITSSYARYLSLQEIFLGLKTIRVFGVQGFFMKKFERASKKHSTIQPRFHLISTTPKYLLEILAFGGIIGVTIYMILTAGDLQSVLPILSLYAFAGLRLLPAIQKVYAAVTKVKHNFPALQELYDDLNHLSNHKVHVMGSSEQLPFEKRISIEQVGFTYDDSKTPTLSNINLEIPKGQTVAFVGSTGSGKTTLIDLLVGLLFPTEGSIKVDDEEVTAENIVQWQNRIAYVPQEVFLMDDTIANNIALGAQEEEIDWALLKAVVRVASIDQLIEEDLEQGYQTTVGERGTRLSGGEKQRLGLARALYQQPSVIVLDEATSALDNVTENNVIEALQKISRGTTVIIIAHRLSTVKYADRIYLLSNGVITAEGRYDELVERSSIFKEMVQFS
ncbi:MAG: ABC transporter ATP-binding protein [Bacteroidota bacterium]